MHSMGNEPRGDSRITELVHRSDAESASRSQHTGSICKQNGGLGQVLHNPITQTEIDRPICEGPSGSINLVKRVDKRICLRHRVNVYSYYVCAMSPQYPEVLAVRNWIVFVFGSSTSDIEYH